MPKLPLHDRPEIMFNPEIIDRLPGFSLRLEPPVDPLTDDTPWRLGLNCYVGHYLVFDLAGIHRVWRIVDVDHRHEALIGRWPD